MRVPLLVASRNAKKLRELRRVLDAAGIAGLELRSLADVPSYPEAPEDGASFAENALIKAREGLAHTGLATIADDSGLAVDALGGMPGVLSARWSGIHGDDAANNRLLLAQLAVVPDARRSARFVSAVALVLPDGSEITEHGYWEGQILREPVGENGFGYDPLFVPTGGTRSSAQLSAAEKDAASHRGQALARLIGSLRVLATAG